MCAKTTDYSTWILTHAMPDQNLNEVDLKYIGRDLRWLKNSAHMIRVIALVANIKHINKCKF